MNLDPKILEDTIFEIISKNLFLLKERHYSRSENGLFNLVRKKILEPECQDSKHKLKLGMQIFRIWDKDKDNIRTNVHNRLKVITLNPKENDMVLMIMKIARPYRRVLSREICNLLFNFLKVHSV